jgi:L-rhamnose mutarotase
MREVGMQVVCEMMRLRPECVEEYVAMHRDTWPELVDAIRASGFREEYIYMRGTLVIVLMKCRDFRRSVERLLATAVFQKWTARVRAMLVPDEALFGTREPLLDLHPIWSLSDFPRPAAGTP